jgi:hypothetical protein
MSIVTAVLALLLSASTAQAKTENAPNGVPWKTVYKRAESTYTVGRYTSMGSFVLSLYGSLTDSLPIFLAGEGAKAGGTGAMAGSTLRQRQSVNARGGQVSGGLGYASWGALGGAAGLSIGSYLVPMYNDPVTGEINSAWAGLYVGSIAADLAAFFLASAQHSKNARGRYQLARGAHLDTDPPKLEWSVRPIVGERHTGGAIEGRF